MKRWIIALSLLCAAGSSHALYRCDINGKIEYRDMPCPAGRATELRVDPMNPTQQDQAYARLKTESDIRRYGVRKTQDVDTPLRERARFEEKRAQRNSVRCDQMRRSVELAAQSAGRNPSPHAANNLINMRQDYDLACR
jgi:hypothetical protein